MSNNLNLTITNLRDGDVVTEVTGTALNLNALVQELLEGGDVEDLVVDGLRSVDDELLGDLLTLLGLGGLLHCSQSMLDNYLLRFSLYGRFSEDMGSVAWSHDSVVWTYSSSSHFDVCFLSCFSESAKRWISCAATWS